MLCKDSQVCPVGFLRFHKVRSFILLFEPGCLRFFKVHLQHINIWKPLVPVYPELALSLTIGKACRCWAVRVKNDLPLGFFFQVPQGIQRYLIVAYWYEDKD